MWHAPFEQTLDDDTLRTMYRDLVLARLLDERLIKLQRMGKTSFVAPTSGHEGAHIGTAYALRAGFDWLFPYYRDLGLVAALGVPLQEILGQMLATQADPNKGRQMPNHPGFGGAQYLYGGVSLSLHIFPRLWAQPSV